MYEFECYCSCCASRSLVTYRDYFEMYYYIVETMPSTEDITGYLSSSRALEARRLLELESPPEVFFIKIVQLTDRWFNRLFVAHIFCKCSFNMPYSINYIQNYYVFASNNKINGNTYILYMNTI